MRLGSLIPAVFVIISGATLAQQQSRWVVCAVSNNIVVEYDSQSMSKSGDEVTVWLRYTYTKDPAISNGAAIHHAMQREYYNCSTRLTATYTIVNYNSNGDVISQGTDPSPSYDPVIPGSIAEGALTALCK